jgi:hypothetical protein
MLRWARGFSSVFGAVLIVFDPHFIELDTLWGRFAGASANVSRIFAKTLTFVKCFTGRKTMRDSAVGNMFV